MNYHIATLTEKTESGTRIIRVVADGNYVNTGNAPALADYLSLELTDGYVECSRGKDFVITVSASDLNSA
jgi:hypothetical protein